MGHPKAADKVKAQAENQKLQDSGLKQPAKVNTLCTVWDVRPSDLDHHECDGNGKDGIAEQDHAFELKFAPDFGTGVVGHAIISEECPNYANFASTFSISATILSFDRLPILPSWVW